MGAVLLASHVTFPRRDIPNKSLEGRICAGITRGNPAMKLLNRQIEDGSYRYPLHGDLPNIKTRADEENERRRIERNRDGAMQDATLSFDGYNEPQAHTDTDPKVSVSDLVGHVLSPATYHAYAIYLREEVHAPAGG